MRYKQDYNEKNDITLGSAIAIINHILKEDYETLKSSKPTKEEVVKKAHNAWTLEKLIAEYLGKYMTMGMDSWKVFWCGLWLDIYKTKIIEDVVGTSTITGIQLHKNIKEKHEGRLLSEIVKEYKEIK